MKKHDGFTLVELMVVIAIGSIVMLAASTVLLLGLRLNKHSAEDASERNQVRVALYVMETTAKQKSIVSVDAMKVTASDGVLFSYNSSEEAIYMGDNESLLLDGVKTFAATYATDRLLTITISTEVDTYKTSVYCRSETPEPIDGSSNGEESGDLSLTSDTTIYNIEARENFLSVLASEVGSTGRSLTTGEYFSEWYIGSYEANPEWGPDTPWCACFLSWALEQCGDDLFGGAPRYAHVDRFMEFFPVIHTDAAQAQPGDVIFFDMEEDGAAEATHVGAVVRVEDGFIHTIEGNTAGTVAGRKYALDDERIMGYGILNWK